MCVISFVTLAAWDDEGIWAQSSGRCNKHAVEEEKQTGVRVRWIY